MIKMLPMNYWRLNEQTLSNKDSVIRDIYIQDSTKSYIKKIALLDCEVSIEIISFGMVED